MKIAIPIAEGFLSAHFAHCQEFAFIELDQDSGKISGRTDITPPQHAPGVLPKWVAENGADIVLVGGMGSRAVNLFEENGVRVLIGCPSETPEKLVEQYANGTLRGGTNICDH